MSSTILEGHLLKSTARPIRHHLDSRADQLAEQGNGNSDDLLNTVEVAAWLGVSIQFVEIGRHRGYGPKFTRVGPRVVRYRRQDVISWLTERVHASTAEYEASLAGPGRGRAAHRPLSNETAAE
jgi:predicted DNA-binding transcriptional regulator AlpA